MYYLSEAGKPPEQKFVDPINQRYPTLPFYDEQHFEDMYAIMSVELAREQDKVMMGMLKTLGIERGKPFAPDATAKRAMRQAAIEPRRAFKELLGFAVMLAACLVAQRKTCSSQPWRWPWGSCSAP
jgi:hypothetical protein